MAEPRFEEIRPRTRSLGRELAHHARVGSTMDEARRWAAAGASHGAVLVADSQTRGRGRAGRSWTSPTGNLYATVLLRSGLDASLVGWVPLLAGVAVAEACEALVRVPARVKWPNDVVVGGRKLAGVLSEAQWEDQVLASVLVGFGVNGNTLPEGTLRVPATSLSDLVGRAVCLPALLKVLLERFERGLAVMDGGVEDLASHVSPWLDTLGRAVRVVRDSDVVEGRASSLGPRGELMVETVDAEVFVSAGDCEHLEPSPDAE